ncbi:hypothetical protein KY311_00725 [Candidatus Woesearchaeota archaeon]|nr:hypothetical protein [Candidatus Woesearchaeota archaeon]
MEKQIKKLISRLKKAGSVVLDSEMIKEDWYKLCESQGLAKGRFFDYYEMAKRQGEEVAKKVEDASSKDYVEGASVECNDISGPWISFAFDIRVKMDDLSAYAKIRRTPNVIPGLYITELELNAIYRDILHLEGLECLLERFRGADVECMAVRHDPKKLVKAGTEIRVPELKFKDAFTLDRECKDGKVVRRTYAPNRNAIYLPFLKEAMDDYFNVPGSPFEFGRFLSSTEPLFHPDKRWTDKFEEEVTKMFESFSNALTDRFVRFVAEDGAFGSFLFDRASYEIRGCRILDESLGMCGTPTLIVETKQDAAPMIDLNISAGRSHYGEAWFGEGGYKRCLESFSGQGTSQDKFNEEVDKAGAMLGVKLEEKVSKMVG